MPNLAPGEEKNVGFRLKFNCDAGDRLVTVGLGQHTDYLYLSSAAMSLNWSRTSDSQPKPPIGTGRSQSG
jgi:hypothetical protein